MDNNDDLLKNYIESQKRQKEILKETKENRLKNKNNAEQTKKISQDTKDELKNDREFVLAEIKKNSFSLNDASKELRADREVVLAAVKSNWVSLRHVYGELRADREIVLTAVKSSGFALQYASENLRGDREIVLEAVKSSEHALGYASKELRSDREIVLTAVKSNWIDLRYASAVLRADKEIVLAAVKSNGRALVYASNELRSDRDVVLASIENKESSLKHVSEGIKNECEIVVPRKKNNCFSFEDASIKLKEGLDEKNYLESGLNRFEKNDFKRAINDFTRAIRLNPENTDIYLVRANAKIKCEQFKKAIEDFNLYLQCNSKNLNPFLDRGDCYLKLGSSELALKDYDKASSLGSEIGEVKKNNLESLIQKNKKLIKRFSKEIDQGTMNPKVYFSRAMAYQKEEGCDYELVINDLNKCINLDSSYEEAYFQLTQAKTVLSDRYSQEEISADLEKYNTIKLKRINEERLEAYISEIDQKIQSNPLKPEILLHLIKNLNGKYTEEQIAIASGYFYKSGKEKFLDEEKFLEAKSKKVNSIDAKDDSKYPHYLRYASEFFIYKERFCLQDGEHGGRVFIPSRIVNESKEWDYSQAKLKDYNLNNLFDDNYLYLREEEPNDEAYKLAESMGFSREKAKEMHLESRQERESELREEIKMHSFNEPMKYIDVEQYWFLDENLESVEWFEHEEIAEFHGIRYEDCDHENSSWCEG